jgi:ATP-dependent exoDNAse (exonuclease V) alpha subunit
LRPGSAPRWARRTVRSSQSAPVERFGLTYRIGDKVMQTENNYDRDVFNGDLGFITAIDMEEAELLIDFDGRAVAYPFGELDEVTLTFATTIRNRRVPNIRPSSFRS